MPFKYSANIGFLWDHLPLPERIMAASKAGFDAVECHFPYVYEAPEAEYKPRGDSVESGLSWLTQFRRS